MRPRPRAAIGAWAFALLSVLARGQTQPVPVAGSDPPDDLRAEEEWSIVRVADRPVGRGRRTVTFLAEGRVATRQEQVRVSQDAAGPLSRLELLVVEDNEGRVLWMEQRRRDGARESSVRGVVAGDRLSVVGPGGDRNSVAWDQRVRGPAFCRRDRGSRVGGLRLGDRFTLHEFSFDLGRSSPTHFEVGPRAGALTELLAESEGAGSLPLRLWIDADGVVMRTVFASTAGETVVERVPRDAAPALPLVDSGVDLRDGRLEVGSPGLRLPCPAGYRWFDWTGRGLADLSARAAGLDGRTLHLAGRPAPPGAPLDPATLRAALGADAVVAVERQAGGRPALIAKDGATGTWGLAVRVGPALLVTRTDRGDDAALEALRQLADGLRFGP